MTAFNGDPAVRAAVAAELAAESPPAWADWRAGQADRIVWADSVGLPPALVLLAVHLCQRFGDPSAGAVRLALMIAAIEPGARVEAVAHRFVVWAWRDADEPLSELAATAAWRASGEMVAELHARAAEGQAIDRRDWRAARAMLGRYDDDAAAQAAAVMAASAWDLAATPGAAVDMVSAWEGLIAASLFAVRGWGTEEADALQQQVTAQNALARTRIGPEPAVADADAHDTWRRATADETLRLLNATGDPLLSRKAALNAEVAETRNRLREAGLVALLSLLSGPSAAPGRLISNIRGPQ